MTWTLCVFFYGLSKPVPGWVGRGGANAWAGVSGGQSYHSLGRVWAQLPLQASLGSTPTLPSALTFRSISPSSANFWTLIVGLLCLSPLTLRGGFGGIPVTTEVDLGGTHAPTYISSIHLCWYLFYQKL